LLINTILFQGNTYIRQLDREDNYGFGSGSGFGRPKIFQIWINAPLIFFSLFPKFAEMILQGNTFILQLDGEDNYGSGSRSGRPKIFQIWINAPSYFFDVS
jgi:hypothetical protein